MTTLRLAIVTSLVSLSLATPVAARIVSSSASSEPMACTMEAKLCPDGKTYVGRDPNHHCEFSKCPPNTCPPYVCADGATLARCAEDGTVINYFAEPCLTHGGELPEITSVRFSSDLDTMTVTLSEDIGQKVHIRYYLYPEKMTQHAAGAGFNTQGLTGTLSGLLHDFKEFEDYGPSFRFEFRVCPYNEPYTGLHTDEHCTQPFDAHVTYAAVGFSDVLSTHPNARAIAYVKAEGIVEGYADGTFKPDATINRAEFLKMIVESFRDTTVYGTDHGEVSAIDNCIEHGFGGQMLFRGETSAGGETSHLDVYRNDWFAKYVCAGMESHLISGYPDGTFRPANPINVVEAAKILANAFVAPEMHFFDDQPSDPWYRVYIEALTEKNAIPLSIASFDQKITRGEMAEMVWRLKAHVQDLPTVTFEQLQKIPYANSTLRFSLSYPASLRITQDGPFAFSPESDAKWYRLTLEGYVESSLVFEVNPPGYGPIFADTLYTVAENPDGSLRIVKTEKYDDEYTRDGKTIAVMSTLEATNGNAYYARYSYEGSTDVMDEVFENIIKSIRITK